MCRNIRLSISLTLLRSLRQYAFHSLHIASSVSLIYNTETAEICIMYAWWCCASIEERKKSHDRLWTKCWTATKKNIAPQILSLSTIIQLHAIVYAVIYYDLRITLWRLSDWNGLILYFIRRCSMHTTHNQLPHIVANFFLYIWEFKLFFNFIVSCVKIAKRYKWCSVKFLFYKSCNFIRHLRNMFLLFFRLCR